MRRISSKTLLYTKGLEYRKKYQIFWKHLVRNYNDYKLKKPLNTDEVSKIILQIENQNEKIYT